MTPISEPLLDRIDIHVEVPRVAYEKLSNRRLGEPSECIFERVERAREIPQQPFSTGNGTNEPSNLPLITCNSDMRQAEVQ